MNDDYDGVVFPEDRFSVEHRADRRFLLQLCLILAAGGSLAGLLVLLGWD